VGWAQLFEKHAHNPPVLGAPASMMGVGDPTLQGTGPSFCQSFMGLITVDRFAPGPDSPA
jgi:hypothetical protein